MRWEWDEARWRAQTWWGCVYARTGRGHAHARGAAHFRLGKQRACAWAWAVCMAMCMGMGRGHGHGHGRTSALASRVEPSMRTPSPTTQPGPMTTRGPRTQSRPILASGWIITSPRTCERCHQRGVNGRGLHGGDLNGGHATHRTRHGPTPSRPPTPSPHPHPPRAAHTPCTTCPAGSWSVCRGT